jgi:broad specificity phosphatase PhoE
MIKLVTKFMYISLLTLLPLANSFAMEPGVDEDCDSQITKKHLILIRHGASEHNRALRILKEDGGVSYNYRYNSNPQHHNYTPSNLLEEGKIKLADTANELHKKEIHAIDTIAFVSPLPRTKQSAQILIEHGIISENYITDERIIEAQAGDLEGAFGLYLETNQKRTREDKDANHYESREMLARRVKQFIYSLQNLLSTEDRKNIVIVSHGAVLAILIQIFHPGVRVEMRPGSYLEYDLSFDPNKPNELGKLTQSEVFGHQG